jgi:serine/threonine-protein kinase HipA
MNGADAFMYIDHDGETRLVGSLWISSDRRGTMSCTFRYAESWIDYGNAFAIDPWLDLSSGGPFHKDRLFGAIADSAPDRWGRTLIARSERLRARKRGKTPRHLNDLDYVLAVSDLTRHGALRFALAEGGDFAAPPDDAEVPPLLALPHLMAAAQGFLDNPDSEEDLNILLAPGSSLGGARPKASVIDDDGRLSMAKFPKNDDAYSVSAWEHLALELARAAGISAAESRLLSIDARDVILLPRFDREGTRRIPFLSAMSAMDAVDQEPRSYLEIAEALRRFGASTRSDLRELWRRIVFNVLISNTDDHLRNHGLLYAGSGGWRLSPAYDLNPIPANIKPRFLSTAIGVDPEDTTASLELAFAVAEYFDMEEDEARVIAHEVGEVTRDWADRAHAVGIKRSEIDIMTSAFEHEDLVVALGGSW